MRYKFAIQTDGLSCLRVTPYSWRPEVQREAAKASDLNPFSGSQRLGHLLKHGFDG
ncbi:conserved protein of unknown function [Pseudomonas marincola]|uniref:Uncharacterized protein n=1 Tax=Pseudomonas marincola TaxID=437900 RepID=A0A653E6Z1_9PSED|nr:conserved protein of unknown function [Pseudomonas marincola]